MTGRRRVELEVVALSGSEWRVCDGRIDEGDARRILGYIELRDERYEVLALRPAPAMCGCFGSWEECLGALERATAGTAGPTTPGGA